LLTFSFFSFTRCKKSTISRKFLTKKRKSGLFFCSDFFLSRVVGVSTWKDGSLKIKVLELATASDEAFAYLLIENYWDQWSTVDLEVYKNEATFETNSMKKRKERLFGENSQKMPMVHDDMVDGQMKAVCNSIIFMRR